MKESERWGACMSSTFNKNNHRDRGSRYETQGIIDKIPKIMHIFPEQFTVKAHPALFEGKGGGEPKNEARLFQSRVEIHSQNTHKTLFQSTVDIHFQNVHKTHQNCEGSHSVRLLN